MTNQRKWILLGGLLLAWGGVTFFQLSDTPLPGSMPNSAISDSSLPPVSALKLATTFTNLRQSATFSTPRNIFAPPGWQEKQVQEKTQVASAPPPPPKPVEPPPPPPTPSGPSAAELAAQRARQQLNQFRFLGYLTKGGESQAFLTNGQAIYIVRQGEMLEGRVQVDKIEPETIILSTQVWETGNHVEATIPLTPESRG